MGRTRNGSLVGTVRDVSSTVVQNASLELVEVNTGTEGSAATMPSRFFRLMFTR